MILLAILFFIFILHTVVNKDMAKNKIAALYDLRYNIVKEVLNRKKIVVIDMIR